MSSPYQDYDLVLQGPSAIDASMAKDLLEASGIPCFLHGRDQAMVDLGSSAHNALTRPDLFVPKGMGERAKRVLASTWTEQPLEPDAPIDVGVPDEREYEQPKVPLSWLSITAVVGFSILLLVLLRMVIAERGKG